MKELLNNSAKAMIFDEEAKDLDFYTTSIMTRRVGLCYIALWCKIVSQKGDPKMIRLSSSMRTYNTNLQGATWKVPFGMHKRMSRCPDNLGLR